MKAADRFLITVLVTGVWILVGLQLTSNEPVFAQDQAVSEEAAGKADNRREDAFVNATEIVGLEALIGRTLREQQLSPRSIAGLDQHIRSIVRRCRVNGGTTGGRISNASITC